MKIIDIKHRPLPLNLDKDHILIKNIQNKLNNEILELTEFKNSFQQILSGFSTSLKQEIDNYIQQLNKNFNDSYQDVLNQLQIAYSCLLTIGVKNNILELFAGCETIEDVKDIGIINKSISLPILSIKENLKNSISFELSLFTNGFESYTSKSNSSSSRNSSNMFLLRNSFQSVNELRERFAENAPKIEGNSTNKFRVLNFTKPINETIYFLQPFTSKISCYNIKENLINEISINSYRFPTKAAWCMNKDGKLIFTGGFDELARKSCFEISINERKCEEIGKMNTARFNHSQISVDNSVYVIGGMQKTPLNECESYSFEKKKWIKFGKLNVAREFPAVCHLLGKIYVAGGNGIETIECSMVTKGKFELLFLRLPGPGRCNMFTKDGQIMILHKGKQISIAMPNLAYKQIGETVNGNFWTCSEYIMYEKNAYWVSEGEFFSFAFETAMIKSLNQD